MKIGSFVSRHLGPRLEDQNAMLRTLGAPSLDDLIERTVPGAIRLRERLSVSKALTESEYLEHIDGLAAQNTVFRNYIGMGYYPTEVPSVIRRNVLENPGWYTAYTPYQAEIAQGRLEALLNFQTMVMDLTGMEVANASLLDEGTAAAEAMAMLFAARPRPQVKAGKNRFVVDAAVYPQTLSVLRTRAAHLDIDMVVMTREEMRGAVEADDVFGCLVQYPDANGEVEDMTGFVGDMAEREVRTVFATDLMALLVLKSPGAMGADVVVGSSQRFGV
ncbi:MAG: glycine dehydrogenase (aminomethyl-transferring), partial [Flavobacteriales bacterium]